MRTSAASARSRHLPALGRRLCLAAGLAAALLPGPGAWGRQARDLQEQLVKLPVTLKSMYDGQQTHDMLLTIYRPQGQGPFPLAVISHGRSGTNRATPKVQRFEDQARFFVRKGFVVLVPTRVGYGDTGQAFDPESSAANKHSDYKWVLEATAAQIMAAVDYGRALPGVDPQRLVLVGQSVGGLATVNAAAQNPAGLVLAINFAGGDGGDPVKHPGVPSDPNQLKDIYADLGRKAKAPMLWVYTENDKYFAPEFSKAWAKAYGDAGGKVDYRLLPPFSDNGHELFARGCDLWMPLVEAYLSQAGFTRPGLIPRPRPSGFAGLAEVDKVPNLSPSGADGYRKFLAADLPRAFAISADGHWGFASGDDALARALANCQRNAGAEAKLYAVDGDVVW